MPKHTYTKYGTFKVHIADGDYSIAALEGFVKSAKRLKVTFDQALDRSMEITSPSGESGAAQSPLKDAHRKTKEN